MAGTKVKPVRCVALQGRVGEQVACTLYAQRSSTCRSVLPGDSQCLKARAAWGLGCSAPAAPPQMSQR
ncbi:hypothetical protein [Inhella gelatinilytica]|uniref:hypothetical protein n=1 Tax=Inhella gelatinilytica TaxID=2795030 RepID=UPI001FE826E6|nr:hypothetical protein [Inhella gelatinilytica]